MTTPTSTITTENGALSYKAEEPLLKLFYHTLRNTSDESMRGMVRNAWRAATNDQERLLILKLLFFTRWCRGGKGERKQFRTALEELIKLGAENIIFSNLENIPYFGYWRDLLFLCDSTIGPATIKFFCQQLKTDLDNLNNNPNLITLAGKWAPSENKKFKHLVPLFCKQLNLSKQQYRKNMTSLRKHLKIVETDICQGRFPNVNYAQLPSLARLKYTKLFKKHDTERYSKYINDVAAGKEKMNIKLVYPYQLVEKYLGSTNSKVYPDDDSLNTMWNELVKQTKQDLLSRGANLQALGVADVSGSMQGVPIQNSVALSLLWSELCEGRFKGHFYTFSSSPRLIKITGQTLKEKVQQVMEHIFYENTNVQAVFEDLLAHAKMWSIPVELYPKTIYMFTDGQFDTMTNNSDKTNLEAIESKHEQEGYPMPQIVFWNLRGDILDFPAPGDKKGVAMLSGFSPALLKLIMTGKELNPTTIMMDALSDPELDRIKLA